jgi:hypothetical protein
MLRINYAMAVAALLLLQAPSSLAIAANTKSDEIPQLAASTIQGEGNEVARSAMQQQPIRSEPASATGTMEYPALALLAMAIISMAALSRRDSLRIDR